MKKSKFLVLGLIALMLAGGLALASCDNSSKCPNGTGDCYVRVQGNYLYEESCANGCIYVNNTESKEDGFKCDC
jgi:hypothetical protein